MTTAATLKITRLVHRYSASSSHPRSFFSSLRVICRRLASARPAVAVLMFLRLFLFIFANCTKGTVQLPTRKAAPSAPLSPDDADLRETLKQDNGRNHGYDNNRHRCKNPIHQPVHRIVFSIVFHVSFSLAIHARRTKMPTSPNRESARLVRIPFAKVAVLFSLTETRKGMNVDDSV
jgi:hypothetical protein